MHDTVAGHIDHLMTANQQRSGTGFDCVEQAEDPPRVSYKSSRARNGAEWPIK